MLKYALAATAAAGVLASAAAAQDYSLPAGYGSTTLNSGFLPDPVAVSLQAGGSIDASTIGAWGCVGQIANAPDYELTFSAGSLPLFLSVESSADTTLVVNGPDGSWYCNDDFDGLNPGLEFSPAQSGVYDIWVGTYWSGDGYPDATLYISEIGTGNLSGGASSGGFASGGPDWSLPPTYGTVSLNTGYTPDPHTVNLQAGGELNAPDYNLGPGCLGSIAAAPDYRVNYTAGTTFPLAFAASSSADTTLIVNAPDGSWHCNDDYVGLNPQVTFNNPLSGQYDVWVGTYWSGDGYPNATLSVTELPR